MSQGQQTVCDTYVCVSTNCSEGRKCLGSYVHTLFLLNIRFIRRDCTTPKINFNFQILCLHLRRGGETKRVDSCSRKCCVKEKIFFMYIKNLNLI